MGKGNQIAAQRFKTGGGHKTSHAIWVYFYFYFFTFLFVSVDSVFIF